MPYQTKQRTRNGVVERLCRYCESWQPLARFVRTTNPCCFGGRLAKCKPCYNGQRPLMSLGGRAS